MSTKYNAMLNNPEQSGACIEIANGELLDAGLRGRLEATVSNPDKVPDCDPEFKLGFTVTTCDHSQQELFSVDEAYKDGWKTVLDPNSYSYMSKIIEGKTVRLPAVRRPSATRATTRTRFTSCGGQLHGIAYGSPAKATAC